MDFNKVRPGTRIAAIAGALLFIDLFLSWYSANTDALDLSASGWEVFSYTDLLCALTAIVAIAAAMQAMGMFTIPVRLSQILLPLAALTTIIVLYRLINQPGDNGVINNEFGAYLGFLLAAATTYGAYLAQSEETVVTSAVPPAAPPPAAPPSAAPPSAAPPSAAPPSAAPPSAPPTETP